MVIFSCSHHIIQGGVVLHLLADFFAYINKNFTTYSRKYYVYITFSVLIYASFNIGKITYINLNSRDLSYAVEYNLTHGIQSNKLMRVKSLKLISKEKDMVIVEASGLSRSLPHKTIYVTASFKNKNNSWQLEKIY